MVLGLCERRESHAEIDRREGRLILPEAMAAFAAES
jgi:hypothetical protein